MKKTLAILRRMGAMPLFMVAVIIFGLYSFIIIYPLHGIDKANEIMEKYCGKILEWWN